MSGLKCWWALGGCLGGRSSDGRRPCAASGCKGPQLWAQASRPNSCIQPLQGLWGNNSMGLCRHVQDMIIRKESVQGLLGVVTQEAAGSVWYGGGDSLQSTLPLMSSGKLRLPMALLQLWID